MWEHIDFKENELIKLTVLNFCDLFLLPVNALLLLCFVSLFQFVKAH